MIRSLGLIQEDLLHAAFEQLGEGVIVADKDGKLIFVNSAAATIHGVKALDVEPDEYTQTYHLLTPDGEPFPTEELPMTRAVTKGETVEDAHWLVKRPDGTVIDAVGTARPVLGEDGTQLGAVLTVSDRTEDFATQKALEDALKMKDTLLYEVNHRVKNNLAIVSALLRLQAKKLEGEDAKSVFGDLSARVGVLSDIHGRLYQTGGHTEIEVVSFLAEQAQANVQALAVEHDVALKVRAKGTAVMSVDRAVPIALAVNELILNSMKHAFAEVEEPAIFLTLEVSGSKLDIHYRDNGPGLPPSQTNSAKKGIGQALIMNLSTQGHATVEIGTDKKHGGYKAAFSFPLNLPEPPHPA
nr:histidine kinase dimerization/phosphoacceptor domain -containing protein [Parvularcula maris]